MNEDARSVLIQSATESDHDALLHLMRGFYAEMDLPFDPAAASARLRCLMEEPGLGRVWLAAEGRVTVAYLAATLGFSLELGRDAFVDELYVAPPHRRQGVARRLIDHCAAALAAAGVEALHLEVERSAADTQRLYAAAGFEPRRRYFLMTRRLAESSDR